MLLENTENDSPELTKIPHIEFGSCELTIEDILLISQHGVCTKLSSNEDFKRKIQDGQNSLTNMLEKDGLIYGVTTGYGDSCTVGIPTEQVIELPLHLTRFHGCGLGKMLDSVSARGVIATRLASLVKGYSGVSMELLERLVWLLNNNVLPLIPEEGSVGASGDLTPLSYLGALLVGERDALCQGEKKPALDIFKSFNVEPLILQPKEGLAIMNGTSVMTALACFAYSRAEYLTRLTSRMTALVVLAMKGNAGHFNKKLFATKPHPGQTEIAKRIRNDLDGWAQKHSDNRLQDRYSLRCAPHVIGVLQDALPMMRQFIEIELNSANDNPIIDGKAEELLHGGHFYGGHIAFAMDSMKNCVANLADLMDRQMALLVDTKYSNGLPPNLSGSSPERASINHGFKAVQIGMSSWTAEALKNTMPASVFSRSTECHNQDKVSMGTIAARDCLRVLELTEQVAAGLLLGLRQAITLRQNEGDLQNDICQAVQDFHNSISENFELVTEDRPLNSDLRQTINFIQKKKWELYL